ncbi:M90 family metallopeptidase [Stutzerimonas azotifigens]|uniref:M90 family metallopeptidase n=1 Tax=Stutzerimonas azotifigens TaxID=291995 RepID=UPI0003F4D02D|nr:M90 family metallopeptidase [Stutzerimonas azotifigens]
MLSLRNWRRRRILSRHLIDADTWQQVLDRLPILDGLEPADAALLRERASLFLHDKRLTLLGDLQLDAPQRASLAALAELPLLRLEDLGWYQGFHELLIYPEDFASPQKHRDPASGVVHEWDDERSGEAWHQGPVILAWPGIEQSGNWDGYNLVIHEMSHKLDMLNGAANGLPPLHRDMRIADWAQAMQAAYDALNTQLDADPDAETPIDPYAAEDPAEFFAVTSEYFFSAPDLLHQAFPEVYRQLALFYRQDTLARFLRLQQEAERTQGA